ncbi:MAG: hypothetical protein SFU25_07070 [Candidatus Caenarcaniphilales bacterium]|nr:hypothetical protein [Candidatus Caenarcaniphilales bacterium]
MKLRPIAPNAYFQSQRSMKTSSKASHFLSDTDRRQTLRKYSNATVTLAHKENFFLKALNLHWSFFSKCPLAVSFLAKTTPLSI